MHSVKAHVHSISCLKQLHRGELDMWHRSES